MNRLLFLFSCMILLATANGQRNYEEAIKQGDAAFKQGQFKLAIDKYFAAEAFEPTKKDSVNKKVKLTFDRIEALRQEAIKLKNDADKLLAEAENQRKIADSARLEKEKQADLAREAENKADSLRLKEEAQKIIAEQNLRDFQELKKTVIGTRYQGGIVISWTDSTGKHGVIAAEKDLGEYSWQEAKDVCNNLVLEGFDDWRLPDRTELAVLYGIRNVVGGFTKKYYWSSTTAGFMKIKAWTELFNSGFPTGKYKNKKSFVRPVRDF